MKALSIKGPWASMILCGVKTIETRTWNTKFRGDFLICVSQSPKNRFSGQAIAVAELYDVKEMTQEHVKQAQCEVYPRAKSWFLRNIRPVEPFPVKGKLSFFEVDDNLIKFKNQRGV